jgi:hypothetical protein
MPFTLNETDCSPLFIDHDFEIVNKDLLAIYVSELLLGHHFHLIKILNSLSTVYPIHPNESIDKVIKKIKDAPYAKRDGWFFQMISWVVLAQRNAGKKFHSNYPHFAPAQHGIDGLAVTLNANDTLKKIIITEDKCTSQPRGKITSEVFPEFKDFESGEKNNALVSIISALLGQLDSGAVLENAQNNIFKNEFRTYRIGITRENKQTDHEGRKKLFLNYKKIVTGDDPQRRTGASVYLPDLRNWMEDFADKVIKYLESKKVLDV